MPGMKAADVAVYAREAWTQRFRSHCEAFLADLDIDWRGLRVLDLGAGPGTYTQALLDAGAGHVTWQDIEPDFEATAREHIADGAPVRYRLADLVDLVDYADGDFDAVIIVEALYWASDEAKLIGELGRIVRPGGWVVIDALAYGRALRVDLPLLRRLAHLASPPLALVLRRKPVSTLWTFRTLTERRLARAGFDVVVRRVTGSTRFLLVGERRAA